MVRREVFTDPLASPTGFPFKVAQLEGTLSDAAFMRRVRAFVTWDFCAKLTDRRRQSGFPMSGRTGDAVRIQRRKLENTVGRKCLCNALVANIGLTQVRNGKHLEQPLITTGDDLKHVTQFLPPGQLSYSAEDVVARLLGEVVGPTILV